MGYMLRGPASRTCGADQKWSGDEASCVAVQCEAIKAQVNVFLKMRILQKNLDVRIKLSP